MKVSRRSAIKMAAAGMGALALPGGVAAWVFRDQIKVLQPKDVAVFLRENFAYLKLEVSEEEISEFYADYREYYKSIIRGQWHRWLKRRDASHFEGQMDHLAVTFLMSTDFFANGADEARPVKYVTLYHPYASPCWNPFLQGADANAVMKAHVPASPCAPVLIESLGGHMPA